MDLIIITPEITAADEPELACQMLTNGLKWLHIRKPSFSLNDYLDYIRKIEKQFRARLIIHGHFELFKELSLGGIHLNVSMRNDSNVWAQIREVPSSKISTSFHSWDEIEHNEFKYRYVFISPVFSSISKPGYLAGIELAGAMATKQKLDSQNRFCPGIVGLGGVGQEQLTSLQVNGFDGAAMLGAIWENTDPAGAFLNAKKVIKALKGA